MEIQELSDYTEEQFMELVTLMKVLDNTLPLKKEVLDALLSSTSDHLFVLKDKEHIIGCATLGVFISPTGKKASIEDVVLHPDYQGKGLSKQLMHHLLDELRKMAPIHVQLTSRPARIAANNLYKAVGFSPKETNVYVLDF